MRSNYFKFIVKNTLMLLILNNYGRTYIKHKKLKNQNLKLFTYVIIETCGKKIVINSKAITIRVILK